MTTLMGFVLNTVKPRVNDQHNAKMWLPALLMGMRNDDGTPVLPIHAANQDLGPLPGAGGAYVADRFNQVYSILKGVDTEADPQAPLPVLSLPQVTLDGLQNMQPAASPDTPNAQGYDVRLELEFDKYTGVVSGIPMPPLTISGTYHIEQSLMVLPSGPKEKIVGDGSFKAQFPNCQLVASARAAIAGAGPDRVNTITVTSLELAAIGGGQLVPTFTELTLDGNLPQKDMLIAAIQDALSDPEGASAFVNGAAAMLNAQANLDSVNRLVSDKTAGVLDGIFGPLPSSGLPSDGPQQQARTALDQYLFDRVRVALTQPDSSWYLPLQLASSASPVLEPYTTASVTVPDQLIKGLHYTDIVISDVVLAGASNAAAPLAQTVLATSTFSSRIALATLPEGGERQVQRQGVPVSMPVPPAPPLRFSAGFALVQQGLKPVPLKGTLAATIANVVVPMTFAPAGADADLLTLAISGLGADLGSAQVVPQVTLEPRNGPLEQILDTLFAKPEVQQQIAAALNQALAQQAGAISDQFTQIARSAILSQLGG